MSDHEIIEWLLEEDISLRYQVQSDLFNHHDIDLMNSIPQEGWCRHLLANRRKNGHWGRGFYQPKWISSHYTLLEIRHLCAPHNLKPAGETIGLILGHEKGPDGGVNPAGSITQSDVCINGMFLNYASWFGADEKALGSVVDFIVSQQVADGGFNCRYNRNGCKHSSLHSTLSVAEGIAAYLSAGYTYRDSFLKEIQKSCNEFILKHRLFISDRTGSVINPHFLVFPWPSRWKFDILRALDYFREAGVVYDSRMDEAIDVLYSKRKKDGRWNQASKHPGLIHFDPEPAGKPGRWNTLRALRVLKTYASYPVPMDFSPRQLA